MLDQRCRFFEVAFDHGGDERLRFGKYW